MDFIVDTVGDDELQLATELKDEGEKPIFVDKAARFESILALCQRKKEEMDAITSKEDEVLRKLCPKTDSMFEAFFEEMNWTSAVVRKIKKKPKLFHFEQLDVETGKLKSQLSVVDIEKEMKKSVLQPGLEQKHRLPKYSVSDKMLRLRRKKERAKTKGPGWFDLPAPEVTEELKNDLQVLKMRSVLNPKHFYKKNDMEALPKYFQVGKVMDSPLDHVNERLTRKQRKRTMVDELLADSEFQKYNKRKYKEIIVEKRKTEYRTFMKDKRHVNKAELKKNKVKGKKTKN
ncbi:deoxynucleotidyltransferase terminal-interacting protein 2 [Cydia amplana]|uniref:deoxynucleotidyltransferase terminal-interacting protein 2 n=1 Tax=Cydia amplana TaxID=1869771 RepID=UPI002FE5487F